MISLIRALQRGEVSGATLGIAERRRVVEHLTLEGYGVAEIAEVLKVVERTIHRDRQAVRAANALEVTPGLAGEVLGQLLAQAEAGAARLSRIARDSAAPAAARVEAERSAWQVRLEAFKAAQSVGFIPTAPTHLVAQLGPVTDPMALLQELRHEVDRVRISRAGAPPLPADLAADADRLTQCCDAQTLLAKASPIAEPEESDAPRL